MRSLIFEEEEEEGDVLLALTWNCQEHAENQSSWARNGVAMSCHGLILSRDEAHRLASRASGAPHEIRKLVGKVQKS